MGFRVSFASVLHELRVSFANVLHEFYDGLAFVPIPFRVHSLALAR